MVNLPARVEPGDPITAELFNTLIQRIGEIQAGQNQTPAGAVAVPSVFGENLGDAKAILRRPPRRFAIGATIDAFGVTLDPDLPDSIRRIVLVQLPAAGAYAQPGSAIDMVLSANPGASIPAPREVRITHFDKSKVPVKQQVIIFGQFDSQRDENLVTFDGISAGAPLSHSTHEYLYVVVPENIPNAPVVGGQELVVTVGVKTG